MKIITFALFLMMWACQSNQQTGVSGPVAGPLAAQPKPPIQIIVPSTIPEAHVGVYYSLSLSVTGGKPPYHWSITQGVLPPGLNLTSSGNGKNALISGTPTSTGSYSFTATTVDGKQTVAHLIVKP